ncbi:hypothetical protein AB1Y20_022822 [Prymnesium parvum]|uniref:Ubiquitinyl hydrolase 1 n=1 Tax=Prymnesium parvum TaxID=97485 RepID=A0AB34JEH4_PRYPA
MAEAAAPTTTRLRVVYCDVAQPSSRAIPPFELCLPSDTTLAALQQTLHELHPAVAQDAARVRLFLPAAQGNSTAAEPALVFGSRPSHTLAELGLSSSASPPTVYWASELMRFQEEYATLLPACDPELANERERRAREQAQERERARAAARAAFWSLPPVAWPFAFAAPTFYWSAATSYGEGEMGESKWLQLLPERAQFRLHDHEWSDTGRKSRHTHTMSKGCFRLVPQHGGFALHLMPTHRWSSYRIPPRWDDDAAFQAVRESEADPLPCATVDTEATSVMMASHKLTRMKESDKQRTT